jgi:hypothetical protein
VSLVGIQEPAVQMHPQAPAAATRNAPRTGGESITVVREDQPGRWVTDPALEKLAGGWADTLLSCQAERP